MTRSNQSSYSPKVTKKAFKSELKAHGIPFQKVVQDHISSLKENNKPIPGHTIPTRRNLGRQDGVQWAGDSFICAARVDGTAEDDKEIPLDVAEALTQQYLSSLPNEQSELSPSTHVISLLDIAKPAKKKGVYKEFEVLESVERVIALEDFTFEDEDGSDIWSLVESDSSCSSVAEPDSDESVVDVSRRAVFSYASIVKGRTG